MELPTYYPEFDQEELAPVLREVDGPVNSFKITGESKTALRELAIETGEIGDTDFQHCAPFDDVDQKTIRHDALQAYRIRQNLSDVQDEYDPSSDAMANYAEGVLWQATLVEASRRAFLGSRGLSSDDPEFCADLITQSEEHLYAEPSFEIAQNCLGLFAGRIGDINGSGSDIAKQILDESLAKYPFIEDAAGHKPVTLNPERQVALHAELLKEFKPAFDELKSAHPEITNEMIPQLVDDFLLKIGMAKIVDGERQGWKSQEVHDGTIGFVAEGRTKTVKCGDRTKPITWKAFEQLMVHEVGGHAERADNGYKFSEGLGQGLLGYITAEEGFTTLIEKTWLGSASKSGVIDRDHYRYLIVSYASGTLDGQRHGPKDTLDFAAHLKLISAASKLDSTSTDTKADMLKTARKDVFEHTFQAFRGMPKGSVLTLGLSYHAGFVNACEYFNNTDRSMKEALAYVRRGKFDYTSPTDIEIVEKLYGSK